MFDYSIRNDREVQPRPNLKTAKTKKWIELLGPNIAFSLLCSFLRNNWNSDQQWIDRERYRRSACCAMRWKGNGWGTRSVKRCLLWGALITKMDCFMPVPSTWINKCWYAPEVSTFKALLTGMSTLMYCEISLGEKVHGTCVASKTLFTFMSFFMWL